MCCRLPIPAHSYFLHSKFILKIAGRNAQHLVNGTRELGVSPEAPACCAIFPLVSIPNWELIAPTDWHLVLTLTWRVTPSQALLP